MGIYDRDYMRERNRKGPFPAAKKLHASTNSFWGKSIVFLAIFGVLFVISKYSIESRQAIPFPLTGQVQWYRNVQTELTAPLTIAAPMNHKDNFVVRLDEWEGKAPVALIPIRTGETAVVQIPLGRYRLTIASGKTWQGSDKMFGSGGDIRVAVAPFEFYKVNNQMVGHRIDLTNRLNGNLQTRPPGLF